MTTALADPPVVARRPDAQPVARHDRPPLAIFVADAATEAALRDGLADAAGSPPDVRRGGIRAAIAAMRRSATPRMLIVDVGGEAHPLTALADLADVVEPDVQVLVIGDPQDLDFYRQVTRGLGSLEYLPKPLKRETVARHFAPLVAGEGAAREMMNGGRVVTVTGARGGVGASTIAAHLAWHFAVDRRRHTVLLDPDLQMGNVAMLLGAKATSGLRMVLEAPDRADELLVERAAQPVEEHPAADRLHVLAAEEKLGEQPAYATGAAERLVSILHRRYSFIVADVPTGPFPLFRDLLDLAHQRVFVMEPTLASLRDTLRLLALPAQPLQTRRPIVVLNRVGIPGGLTRRQVEDGLKAPVDVAIPDLPRRLGQAATLGEPATASRGGFRSAMVELARQAAFERLLDRAGNDRPAEARRRRLPLPRLFGRPR